jgi:hypothetical protein
MGDDKGGAGIVPPNKFVCFWIIDKATGEPGLEKPGTTSSGRGEYAYSLLRNAGTRGCDCGNVGCAEACSVMLRKHERKKLLQVVMCTALARFAFVDRPLSHSARFAVERIVPSLRGQGLAATMATDIPPACRTVP